MVLARSLYKRIPDEELKKGLDNENLLIVSPFKKTIKRATFRTARKRNELMVKLADDLVVAYASPNGSISKLIQTMKASRKLLYTIDVEENEDLLENEFKAI